jgi:hypothetical protein
VGVVNEMNLQTPYIPSINPLYNPLLNLQLRGYYITPYMPTVKVYIIYTSYNNIYINPRGVGNKILNMI